MKAVVMPALGVAMSEGLLLSWLKVPGDVVAEGDAIAEIETDKSTVDVTSPAAGTIGELLVEPGAVVPVGTALTHILEPGDEAGADAPGAGGAPSAAAGSDAGAAPGPSGPTPSSAAPVAGGPGARMPNRLSPRERRMAREAAERGAGPATGVPATPGAVGGPAAGPAPAVVPGKHRDLIAAKVSESWRTIPHFAVTREVDAEAMVGVREGWSGPGERPSFTDLMVRALAIALREAGEAAPVDVGLAVATPQGVAIPVIRGVLALDLAGIRQAREAAVARARAGRLTPDDLANPPRSTLSNLGAQGIDSFTGVIALGQGSLLTVGRVAARPYVAGRGIAVRDSFIATLNVDHRTFDGDDAARLLLSFVSAVEDAVRLEKEVVLA